MALTHQPPAHIQTAPHVDHRDSWFTQVEFFDRDAINLAGSIAVDAIARGEMPTPSMVRDLEAMRDLALEDAARMEREKDAWSCCIAREGQS